MRLAPPYTRAIEAFRLPEAARKESIDGAALLDGRSPDQGLNSRPFPSRSRKALATRSVVVSEGRTATWSLSAEIHATGETVIAGLAWQRHRII